MSLGVADIIRNHIGRDVQKKIAGIKAAYAKGEAAARNSLDAGTPQLTGALRSSNEVGPLASGIGYFMSSFGDKKTGKAYAGLVNSGHFTKTGSFVPPNPYYSRAEADGWAATMAELRRIGFIRVS